MLKRFMAFMLMLTAFSIAEAAATEFPFPLGADVSARFAGTVHRNDLIDTEDIYKLPQTNVISFERGSHSGWHTHGASPNGKFAHIAINPQDNHEVTWYDFPDYPSK